MTLSRGPYNELDKMSLFQDLKLKRRKVDSRCSSDGESLADTSTSSPDLPPLSPKMCDASPQQGNTNQTSISSHQSHQSQSMSSSTPPPSSSSPPETTSSEDHEATITTLTSTKRDSSINDGHHENPSTTTNDHNSHIHPNGTASNSGISVIIENRPRSHSPAPSSPIRRSPVNTLLQQTLTQSLTPSSESNSHHQQQHVTVLVTPPRIKSETHHLMNAMTRKLPPVSNISSIDSHSLPITAPMSGLSQLQHHHQINQVQIPFTSAASTTAIASGFKRNITGQISPNHPHHQNHHHHHHHPYPIDVQQRIKRERSPNSHLTIIPQPNNQMRQQQQPLSPHQIPISSSAAAVFHGTPLQMRGAQGFREATMLFRIKNESQMAMPPNFMPSAPPQRMMWGPQARINGVKPEVIGGPLPPLRQQVSPQSSPQQQTSPKHNSNKARTTPTVIMGESCGVRTMVWGFESVVSPQSQQQQQQQQQQQSQVQNLNSPVQSPPGTSQSSNHSTSSNLSSNNEEAAHLLLSLGQGVRPIIEVSREILIFPTCVSSNLH